MTSGGAGRGARRGGAGREGRAGRRQEADTERPHVVGQDKRGTSGRAGQGETSSEARQDGTINKQKRVDNEGRGEAGRTSGSGRAPRGWAKKTSLPKIKEVDIISKVVEELAD